jgi:hypothetical protein
VKKIIEVIICILLHPIAVILIWIDLATRSQTSGLAKLIWAIAAIIPIVPIIYVLTSGDLW